MIAVIIGFGSIGQRHYRILKKIKKIKKIYICSNQKNIKKNLINEKSLKKINPDYIVIAKPTSEHYHYCKKIEKLFKNKKVLIEKPLFNKLYNYKFKNNDYFVGYNLRFHPIINFVKGKIKNKKIISAKFYCGSNLKNWRKNIHYTKSSSALKKSGGGVLNDLSHEIDFLYWFFGDLKFDFFKKEKISKLKINVEDSFEGLGKAQKVERFSVSLNYFSKLKKRFFLIDAEKFSIYADLLNLKLKIVIKNKIYTKFFEKHNYDDTYSKMHMSILNKNYSKNKNLCTLKEGLKIQSFLNKSR